MPARVNRLVRSVIAFAVTGALALGSTTVAFADETGSDTETRRSRLRDWIPAVSLSGEFSAQTQESAVSSSCDHGGPGGSILAPCTQGSVTPGVDPRTLPPQSFTEPAILRPSHDASDLTLWPSVGIEFQLASPILLELPFDVDPRLFVSGSVSASFPPTRTIATEGNLGTISLPEVSRPIETLSTISLEGVGSHTESVVQTLQYSAQVGISIPIQYRGRTINIKPSFGWSRFSLDVTGRVAAAVKDDVNGISGSINTPFGANIREIYLRDKTTLDVDGIGPGLEVEYIPGRFGDFGAAVFVGVNAYKVMGDRDVSLDDDVTFQGGPGGTINPDDLLLEDTYRAAWEHEIDPWFFRLRVGMRIHYMPQ